VFATGQFEEVVLTGDPSTKKGTRLAVAVQNYIDFNDLPPDCAKLTLIAARNDILYFVDWSVSRYHDFYEMCCSSMLRSPYNPDKDESWFERWLAATLGEFVIFSMPELVPNLEDVLPDVQLLVQLPLDSQPNILIPPPGYPSPLGRKLVENQVRWGYSRWWH
jgi:hypothetical protein